MAKIEFTTKRIADHTCEPGKAASFLWDAVCPSLGLRTAAPSSKKPQGAKSYIFQAKLNGEVIRITIGRPSAWSIPDARTEARRLMTLVDSGQDPRQVKADALAADQAARDEQAAKAAATEEAERRASVVLADAWPEYLEYGKTKRNKRTGEIGWSAAHMLSHIELSAPSSSVSTVRDDKAHRDVWAGEFVQLWRTPERCLELSDLCVGECSALLALEHQRSTGGLWDCRK